VSGSATIYLYRQDRPESEGGHPPRKSALNAAAVFDSKLVVQEGKKNKVNEDPAFKKRMAFVEDQVLTRRSCSAKATCRRFVTR